MKWFTSLVAIAGVGILGWWLFSGGEQVGELVEDQGREHVTDTRGFVYNSNPPTSGPHYAQWTKRGIYNEPIEDGYLIHSLEHGYIVISYDCTKLQISNFQFSIFKKIYAHEEGDEIPEGEPHPATESGQINDVGKWQSDECRGLKQQLQKFYDQNKNKRLVVVPRADLKTPIALTAWNRLLALGQWDEVKAKAFIAAWENKGPERTME